MVVQQLPPYLTIHGCHPPQSWTVAQAPAETAAVVQEEEEGSGWAAPAVDLPVVVVVAIEQAVDHLMMQPPHHWEAQSWSMKQKLVRGLIERLLSPGHQSGHRHQCHRS